VYWEGYRDNNKSSWTYTTPLTYPYYSNITTTTTANPITLGSTIKGNEIKNEI